MSNADFSHGTHIGKEEECKEVDEGIRQLLPLLEGDPDLSPEPNQLG